MERDLDAQCGGSSHTQRDQRGPGHAAQLRWRVTADLTHHQRGHCGGDTGDHERSVLPASEVMIRQRPATHPPCDRRLWNKSQPRGRRGAPRRRPHPASEVQGTYREHHPWGECLGDDLLDRQRACAGASTCMVVGVGSLSLGRRRRRCHRDRSFLPSRVSVRVGLSNRSINHMMVATSPTQAKLTHHPARMSLGK